ncbi:sensor histidine kinase [Phytohabitans suffuscus]
MTRRVLVTYVTFALLVLLALEVPLGYVYQRGEQQRAFAELEHDAEVLAAFVNSALDDRELSRVELLARETGQRLGGHVEVVDAEARLVTGTHPDRPAGAVLGSATDIQTVLRDGNRRVSARTTGRDGEPMMSVAVPIHPGQADRGALRLSVPTTGVVSRIHQFWALLAAAGLLVLASVAGVAAALARWITRPVIALERATRQLADGVPPPPPPTTGPPELRRLAATFEATATRLQDLIASQRAFVGHASHQLKTPLAALRLRLENLEPDIRAAGDRNLRAALAETDRLAQLIETLLTMARLEQTTPPHEPADLSRAVAERVFHWAPLAADNHVRLTATGPEGVWVDAVPGAVDQILDNLLSNAIRAAPSGSSIQIGWAAGPTAELHVVDEGPGMTADQRVRALEPFWRAPGAPKNGTGLGLALVRKLAETSGGGIELRPGSPGGLDVTVTFAAAPAPARG